MLRSDIRRTYVLLRQSGCGKWMALLRCLWKPGVQAVITFRFGHWLAQSPLWFRLFLMPLYFVMVHRIRTAWGIDLPRTTTVGEGLYIGHFGGIIIAPGAVIGKDCSISQGVTIGAAGRGEKWGCPVIGDHVYIGAGTKIIGKIRIGNHVRIGANAVVHKDIPDYAVVALDPGFTILRIDAPPRPEVDEAEDVQGNDQASVEPSSPASDRLPKAA